jgi:hypothetical protein
LPPSFYPLQSCAQTTQTSPFNIYWQLGGLLLSLTSWLALILQTLISPS